MSAEISPKLQRALQDYIEFFERLSPRAIRMIEKLAEPGLSYKGPLHELSGLEPVESLLQRMFTQTQNPKIKIGEYAWSIKTERTALISWRLSYGPKGAKRIVDGASEILFSNGAKVMAHTDYWDTGEAIYKELPLLNAIIRFAKSKFKI